MDIFSADNIIYVIVLVLFIVLSISCYFLFTKTKETKRLENYIKPEIKRNEELNQLEEKNDEIEIIIDPKVEKISEPLKQESESKIEVEIPKIKETIEEEIPKLNINISSKTEKAILKKLDQFENTKAFIKKDINLNQLAKQFDTNTKYLSEIIKNYKNKNFNQYLNELRINYLIDELNNNDKVLNTKVSYLASDFGFNSHSSFSTLFTQYIGQSPSEYIKALKASKKEQKLD